MRRAYRGRIAGLTEEYIDFSNRAILQHLLTLAQYEAAKTVFCYVSVGREVDTRAFIAQALRDGKRVCVPRCEKNGVMHAHRIASLQDLHPAPMHLWEPAPTAPLVPPGEIDLVVAPCLSCDKTGTRLGQGGGYYDRYLPLTGAFTVCLCRGALLATTLPRGAHDALLPCVATEQGAFYTQD